MSSKSLHYAAWISAIAGLVVIIAFVTGNNKLSDFWRSVSPTSPLNVASPQPTPALQATTADVTLVELLAIQSGRTMTQLQRTAREAELDGKRVKLSGYLVSAEYPMGNIALEFSPTKDDGEKFFVSAHASTRSSWSKIPKGSFVEFQTTLRRPMLGTLVGEKTQLIKVSPP
jgi:hypothetical protein